MNELNTAIRQKYYFPAAGFGFEPTLNPKDAAKVLTADDNADSFFGSGFSVIIGSGSNAYIVFSYLENGLFKHKISNLVDNLRIFKHSPSIQIVYWDSFL